LETIECRLATKEGRLETIECRLATMEGRLPTMQGQHLPPPAE
jgi:hypothetical protein